VGQNYADHAREMGSDPMRNPPFFFAKPADAVVSSGAKLPFPPKTGQLHHEVELVIALGEGGSSIAAGTASAKIFGYAVGIDLTRRDLQAEAKKTGRPWEMGKAFDHSAPIGELRRGVPPSSGSISLSVDGETRQRGDLAQMIWSVPEIISVLSEYVALAPGDLIYTGTPAGVGPVSPGQSLLAEMTGVPSLTVSFES
jgi:fumarylpyruvate hydrolase